MKKEKKEQWKTGDIINFTEAETSILKEASRRVISAWALAEFAGSLMNTNREELFKLTVIIKPELKKWNYTFDHEKQEVILKSKI